MMDKETAFALNDILDAVEEMAKIMREMNPGASFGFIDFVLDRVSRQVSDALRMADRRIG